MAALVVAAAGAGIAVALSGGSGANRQTATVAQPTQGTTAAAPTEPPPPATTSPGPTRPAAPAVSPVEAVFDEAQRATFYSIVVGVKGGEQPTYSWRLIPPRDDPGCNQFHQMKGSPQKAVWFHGSEVGCSHVGTQHNGIVVVTVTTRSWRCTAIFRGTLTKAGPPQQCRPQSG